MSKQYRLAAQDSARSTQIDPAFVRGYARGAKAMLCMGRLDEATALYRQAMEADPGNTGLAAESRGVEVVRQHLESSRRCLAEG